MNTKTTAPAAQSPAAGTGMENSATIGATASDTKATATAGDASLKPPEPGSDLYKQNIEQQNAQIAEAEKQQKEAAKLNTEKTVVAPKEVAPVPHKSLAATLAAKYKEVQENPNAQPLSAAETVVDPFALGKAVMDNPNHPADLDKLDKGSAVILASGALDPGVPMPTAELGGNYAAPGEPFSLLEKLSSIDAPRGAYVAGRLPYLILKTGAKVHPTNGYFVPRSEEEYEMLEHFANQQNGLVDRVE